MIRTYRKPLYDRTVKPGAYITYQRPNRRRRQRALVLAKGRYLGPHGPVLLILDNGEWVSRERDSVLLEECQDA